MSSLYCYLGIRGRAEIPAGFRVYSLVITALICLSTLFTKQHYVMDVAGGLLVAAGCYALSQRLDPARHFMKSKHI